MFFLAMFDAVRISDALLNEEEILVHLNDQNGKLNFSLVHLILGITTFGGFGGQMMLLGQPFCHGSSSTSGSL